MKKKVLALTLSAALALSATPAFAAETNCTKVANKYDFNSLLQKYASQCENSKIKAKVTVNGNTIDWQSLLNKKVNKTEVKKDTTAPTQPEKEKETTETPSAPVKETESSNTAVSSYEQKVVELVNVERQKAGLSALTLDSKISSVARTKSKDMADNNYFAHQSPTYGSAGDMLRKSGINWSAWGENIASGQRTPEAVVTAWMNSPGHKANIMSTNFSKIGVGYVTNSNGTPYWTQMFTN